MAENEQDEQGQPMTAAELAAIRDSHDELVRVNRLRPTCRMRVATYLLHVGKLLADATYWRGKVEQAAERMCALEAENA